MILSSRLIGLEPIVYLEFSASEFMTPPNSQLNLQGLVEIAAFSRVTQISHFHLGAQPL